MKKKEVHVELFGGETQLFEVKPKCAGQKLFQMITEHLDIREAEYFGIFILLKNEQIKWLRLDKDIRSQIKEPWIVKFGVKLYPPMVSDLIEEISRFYIYQQLREDIAKGILLSSFVTHSLLGSLAAQAELGDAPKAYTSANMSNLLSLRLAPNISTSLLERISELHSSHRGLKPAIAELRYLETASKLPLYGLHQFHVKDGEDTHIILAVYAGGILVFEKGIMLNRLAWPSIIELSYKKTIFFVQVRSGAVVNQSARIGFLCPTSGVAKRIWRVAVDHHHFFRKEVSEAKSKCLNLSRTQAELINEIQKEQKDRSTHQSLTRARTIRSSRCEIKKGNLMDETPECIEMTGIVSGSVEEKSLLESPRSHVSRTDSLKKNFPPPKPLRRSRMNLSCTSATNESTPVKSSSPLSSGSENGSRTVIAQVHVDQKDETAATEQVLDGSCKDELTESTIISDKENRTEKSLLRKSSSRNLDNKSRPSSFTPLRNSLIEE